MTIDNRPATAILHQMAEHWPQAITPVSEMMLRVFRLNKLIRANATRCVAAVDLTFSEFQLLLALRREAPPHQLSPTALCADLLLSSGGLTKMLYRLEEKGLIVREDHSHDKRSKLVQLSAAGKTLIESAMQTVLASDGALLAQGLSAAEMQELTRLLHQLLLAIET